MQGGGVRIRKISGFVEVTSGSKSPSTSLPLHCLPGKTAFGCGAQRSKGKGGLTPKGVGSQMAAPATAPNKVKRAITAAPLKGGWGGENKAPRERREMSSRSTRSGGGAGGGARGTKRPRTDDDEQPQQFKHDDDDDDGSQTHQQQQPNNNNNNNNAP